MKEQLPPLCQLAFISADHPRLGAEACGHWRDHTDPSFSFSDILRLILESTERNNNVLRDCAVGDVFSIGDGHLHGQCYAAIDPEGNVVAIDRRNHTVMIFRGTDGELIREFGGEGAGEGQLNTPRGLTVDGVGNIYVGDCDNHCVKVFSPKGEVLLVIGRQGSGDGELNFPCGVAVDDTRQRVYVADCDNDRLVVFGKDGSFVGTMGKSGLREGQFRHPVGVCVDSRGRILVADSDNNRIQVLRQTASASKWAAFSGTVAQTGAADPSEAASRLPFVVDAVMGTRGAVNGALRYPYGVAVAPTPRGEMVAVADSLNHRVSVFTSDGLFVRTFGGPKPGAGREGLKCPYSVAVDGNGSLVVGDGGNKRVVVLGLAMTELGLEAEAAADSSDSASYESY